MKISGTVAIVTGASRGIGRCLAAHLARRGATIALVARESRALEEAATIAREVSPGSLAIATDITSQAAVGSMVRTVLDHFGRVDILVNNAGRGAYGPFLDLAPQTLAEVMAVNFWGTVNCIQAVLPGMIARRSGHIVNLGAVDGKFAVAGDSVGASTKFAVVGLSEALRLELEPVGVHVTLVNPGAVDTESFRTDFATAPVNARRVVVSPERVASAVIDAIEQNRSEVTVPRFLGLAILARYLVPTLFWRVAARACPSPLH